MGKYQDFRGDPESKQFYKIDQFINGIDTEFGDDNSPDDEFRTLINFDLDKRGTANKRKGWGKLSALSQIFNLYSETPVTKVITTDNPTPEDTNDNIVYMKLLINDNNVFRNLSGFSSYRDYQEKFGFQENNFKLLMITTNNNTSKSYAWLFNCQLPELESDGNGGYTNTETIVYSYTKTELPVLFNWDRNLANIETIEFYDKIYFTGNDKGLVVFDRADDTFSYSGFEIEVDDVVTTPNDAYVPTSMEIRKIGFNVLCNDPLHSVNYQGISTDSIQGMYITTDEDSPRPLTVIPYGGKFKVNLLYTGVNNGFTLTFKEGETELDATYTVDSDLSTTGLAVYDVTINNVPSTQVEIKVEKTSATIEPYYDYYDVGQIDPQSKVVQQLNIGDYGVIEMYNRAVYYKGDTIWFSDINIFNYVPNYNYVALPIEPTDEITKIIFFRNVYIIFTKNTIYKMINSFGTTDFEVMPVNLAVGCHAPNTVKSIENEIYFASIRGIYSLKSSEYRDGIENLKELDTKVKSLTNDVTLYIEDMSDQTTKYNGINKNAYAFRYKDKYMLFFNNDIDSETFTSPLSKDVLVYDFVMKNYAEIEFSIKPTFIFIIDNILECYATVPIREVYDQQETLLEYNFDTDTGTNNIITDLSENSLDATMEGNCVLNNTIGVDFNGTTSYIDINDLVLDTTDGFDFSIDLDLGADEITEDMDIFELGLDESVAGGEPISGSMITEMENGYRAILNYNTIPNNNNTDTVNYSLIYERDSTDLRGSGTLSFMLYTLEDQALIPEKSVTFNLQSALSAVIDSGSFIVERDADGTYNQDWLFQVDSTYDVIASGVTLGADTSFNRTESPSWANFYGIRFVGTAVATETGCRITYTPSIYVKVPLHVGSRALYIYINGVKHTHTVPAIDKSNYTASYISAGQQTQDIVYTGENQVISIDGTYNIKATISGTYRANMDVDAFNFTLPSVVPYETTTPTAMNLTKSGNVLLETIGEDSYREIYAKFSIENAGILFGLNSELGEQQFIIPVDNLSGRHLWEFIIDNTTSLFTLKKDGVQAYQAQVNLDYLISGVRNSNYIGRKRLTTDSSYLDAGIYSIELDNHFSYTFGNGGGTAISDNLNNVNATLVSGTWLRELGLRLDGINSYLKLPNIAEDVRFSNGFAIEFNGKLDASQLAKIFDIATEYNTGDNSYGNCSINVGINNNKLIARTTSAGYRSYNITSPNIDLTVNHAFKIELLDNGTNYDFTIYVDGTSIITNQFPYGGVTNILRKSNFIGKSNRTTDGYLKGLLHSFKVITYASESPVPIYESALYEYDSAYTDFGKAIEIGMELVGTNFNYPQHLKKLKYITVKGLGGYNYSDFFIEVRCDGFLVNDPYIYSWGVDKNGTITYDYTTNKQLSFSERESLLSSMRLDQTRLGEMLYELKKIVIPCTGKNFSIKIYGESEDLLKIESFGYVFKLGKVKEV